MCIDVIYEVHFRATLTLKRLTHRELQGDTICESDSIKQLVAASIPRLCVAINNLVYV